MNKIYSLLFGLIFISGSISSQITINEYSASNLNSFIDSFGKTEDWIEIYNSSNEAMDLSGWHLSDKPSKLDKWEVPQGTMIEANGFLVFLCSGRDLELNGEYHTSFKLTQTKDGEFAILSDPNETIIDIQELELTLVEHSRCRDEDGSEQWMISTNPSFGSSNNSSSKAMSYTAEPSIQLSAGYYEGNQTIDITNNEENSDLRYTLDGTNPTVSSPIYQGPINISKTTVVKARAFSNDNSILPGKMDFHTFFIDEDFSLAVFSVAANQVQDLANGEGEIIPIGSIEYFNKDKELDAKSFGSLNRHGQDSWVLDHRSLDWISRDEMGYSKAVNAPIFHYSDRDEYQKFMFRNSGDDNYPAIDDYDHEGSTHIRDEYVQTLAMEGGMELDYRGNERVILFLNGDYWGVYGMREKVVDHDFTDYYYDQGKYETQYLATWESTEIEYGGTRALREWENLRDFILENDMSDPDNYKIAKDSINMTSMIDYMIVNLTVVASDWLNYNTGWWRGLNPKGDHKKWGYILWDLDATFDYYINYSGVPNTNPDALPCDLEEIADFMDFFFNDTEIVIADCPTILDGSCPYPADDPFLHALFYYAPECCSDGWDSGCQDFYEFIEEESDGNTERFFGNIGKHEKIFLKLIQESPEFKQLYYSRYADMMNTTYSCENMINTLDSMLAVIEPEMPRQIERWGGSMGEWKANVEELKNFINQRCDHLEDGMLECYDELTGPFEITLLTEPEGVGEIDFNTLDIEDFPWKGNYFGGMENKIKAKVFSDYSDDFVFSHWISKSGNTISPDVNSRKALIYLSEADTLIAVFDQVTSVEEFKSKYNMLVYPNPVKDEINLEYNLAKREKVEISLHTVYGAQVASFYQEEANKMPGEHLDRLSIDSDRVSSGIYILKVKVGDSSNSFRINIID